MAKGFANTGVTSGLAADRASMTGMVAGQQFFETDTNKLWVYSPSVFVPSSGSTTGAWVDVSDIDIPYAGVHARYVTGVAYTLGNAVPLTTEFYDTHGFHDNVTNNTRFTVPAGMGGYYAVNAIIMINYSTLPSYWGINIRVDGDNNASYSIGQTVAPVGAFAATHRVSGVMYLVPGQYIELVASASGGAGLAILGSSTAQQCTGMTMHLISRVT